MKSIISFSKNILIAHRFAILSTVFALFLSFSFLMPIVVQAQGFAEFTIPEGCNKRGVECSWDDLVMLGQEVLQFAIYLAVLGATVAFVWAGFKMMTNMGNDGEITKAKKILYTAAIGLVITMAAYLIVDFILDKLMVEEPFRHFVQ